MCKDAYYAEQTKQAYDLLVSRRIWEWRVTLGGKKFCSLLLIFCSRIFFFIHSHVSVVSFLFYALSVLLNADETILGVNILRQSFADDKFRIWKLKLYFYECNLGQVAQLHMVAVWFWTQWEGKQPSYDNFNRFKGKIMMRSRREKFREMFQVISRNFRKKAYNVVMFCLIEKWKFKWEKVNFLC